MPVRDFIPLTDSKQTTEIVVKPKPSLDELTTIESPGKPVPATFLETKKPKRKKQQTKEATIITKAKADAILIITEKPQSAMKIAQAIGSPRKYSESGVPFYEVQYNNEKIIVASAVGHLFNLTYEPGQKGWPIFKLEWQPSYSRTSSAFTKKYYSLLAKLAKRAKSFIIATDYDTEGEVIGWNVLRFICKQKDAKRMKYSTLTKNELLHSFQNPMPTLDWGQAYAGETRHYLDWLYGINLSRALMSSLKKSGSFKVLSIGRVQGPALKIIVDREHEIANFKPQPYWQVLALSNKHEFKHPKDIFDKTLLDEFKNIKEAIAETKHSKESLKPPFPFDLTSLQREAYRWHGISPSKTLQIAQNLYLDGLISYPRTSSQKIPFTIEPKKILQELAKYFPQVKFATREKPVEGPKSDPAHPSIFPTGDFKALSGDEEKIYNLIAKRFISAFSPDAVTANTRVTLTSPNNKTFTSSGLKILEKGWLNVYPAQIEESSVPELQGPVIIDQIKFLEKETQPPKRYTPASLITTLEKKNLGTKSTRSTIVETLFQRGYLDGKSIQATPLGMKLVETLEKFSPIILDENLTRSLEEKMEHIQTSSKDKPKESQETIKTAEKLILDISKEFKSHESQIGQALSSSIQDLRAQQNENNTIMPCPVCKQGSLRILYSKNSRRQFVACNRYPDCKTTFSLPPNALIKKTDKLSPEGLPILIAIRKGKRPWEFPFNPNWKANQEAQPKDI